MKLRQCKVCKSEPKLVRQYIKSDIKPRFIIACTRCGEVHTDPMLCLGDAEEAWNKMSI